MKFKQFKDELEKSKSKLYYITISDNLLKKRTIEQFKKKFKNHEIISFLDEENDNFNEIINKFCSSSLFGVNFLIILTINLIKNKDSKNKVLSLVEKPPQNKNILVIIDTEEIKKKESKENNIKNDIINIFKERNIYFQIESPDFSEIKSYIIKFFKKEKITIEDEIPDFIIENTGKDLETIQLELYKIIDFFREKKTTLSIDDIKKILVPLQEENIFKLINSILARDFKKAFLNYIELLNLNVDTDYILNSILRSLDLLIKIKILKEKQNLDDNSIINKLNIHYFRFKKTKEYIQNFNTKSLMRLYFKFLNCQYILRKSSINKEIYLKKIFIDLALISQKK